MYLPTVNKQIKPSELPQESFNNDNLLPPGGVGWLMTSRLVEVCGTEE